MACGHPVEKLAKQATDFVIAKKGVWGHEDWECFCTQAAAEGIELSEHNVVALGNLLESVRYFFQLQPVPSAAPQKTARPCKKATAKKSATM